MTPLRRRDLRWLVVDAVDRATLRSALQAWQAAWFATPDRAETSEGRAALRRIARLLKALE